MYPLSQSVGEEPELGIFSCQDMDIVGKVLVTDETFKAVCDQILMEAYV